jgi:hypothetical protein
MINKANEIKKFLIIFSVFLIFGCSGNQFAWRDARHGFTLGISGFFDHDPYKFCRKIVPNFIGKYQNNTNPSRTCIYYQYYTCHTTHYCPNLPTQAEREKCNQDASYYWLKPWQDLKTKKFLDRVIAAKEICKIEQENCNNGLKNDTRCKHLPSEKYQKIVQESKSKNSQ